MEAWCIPENSATSFAGRYLNACELLEVFPFQSLPNPVQITIAIRGRFVEFHVFGIASVTIHEKKGQPIASMGQIPVTYLTISGFRIKADDCPMGRKGDFSGSALCQFWSRYFIAVIELMVVMIRMGVGQLVCMDTGSAPGSRSSGDIPGGRLVSRAKVEDPCVGTDLGIEQNHQIDQRHLRPFST
ncbi:hypothetical protein N8616_02900 [Verrucomicrobia bacterium]|nr:hypothetical protein [Verrucomicrobiota bacterium]MDA7533294.1 hypothetical protein [Verrucomicrobiota bacterium]MDB4610011.1 hypothetical protein [Verrucomicrobiota bacterium]MDB4626330.1 hypothetical protein [bacterium]MDB4795429.1 hypothetical protein [Verrucomicrobiota bacterium]